MDFVFTSFPENLIRGLNDDEVQFLDQVDQQKMDAERQQHKNDENELREYRERVKDLQEKSIDLVSLKSTLFFQIFVRLLPFFLEFIQLLSSTGFICRLFVRASLFLSFD